MRVNDEVRPPHDLFSKGVKLIMSKKTVTYVPFAKMQSILEPIDFGAKKECTYHEDNPYTEPMPYNHATFAIRDDKGNMKSLIIADKEKPFEDRIAALILAKDEELKELALLDKNSVYTSEGTGTKILYSIPLYLPEHRLFAPTVHMSVSDATNVSTELTLEILFAFEEGFVFPAYIDQKTGGTISMSVADFIKDILNDIEYEPNDFFRDLADRGFPCTVNKDGTVLMYCSAANGRDAELCFEPEDVRRLYRNIVSTRLVRLDEELD